MEWIGLIVCFVCNLAVLQKSFCFGGTVSVIWKFADKCDCATIPMFLDFLRDCCTKMLKSGKIMQ